MDIVFSKNLTFFYKESSKNIFFRYTSADGSSRGENAKYYACEGDPYMPCLYVIGYYKYPTPEGDFILVEYISSEKGHQQRLTKVNA